MSRPRFKAWRLAGRLQTWVLLTAKPEPSIPKVLACQVPGAPALQLPCLFTDISICSFQTRNIRTLCGCLQQPHTAVFLRAPENPFLLVLSSSSAHIDSLPLDFGFLLCKWEL